MKVEVGIEEMRKKKLFIGTPMYGAMCGGQYTKSIADLTAMCAQYQIEVKLFYLFNESLITRARNYIADEFMRSILKSVSHGKKSNVQSIKDLQMKIQTN